jgi:hypothetical protein
MKRLSFQLLSETDEAFYEVLAAALPSNSTLQYLECSGMNQATAHGCPTLFLALQVNNGLKELSINGIEVIDEKSTAMKLGLVRTRR